MNGEFFEYDESDLESVFEDLEYDEARRRRRGRGSSRRGGRGSRGRRGRVSTAGRAWQPQRPATPSTIPAATSAAALRREAEAGRARDKQLAREISVAKEELGDTESQLRKVNSDLARLRQISMISLLLPRPLDTTSKKLTIAQPDGRPLELQETTDQNVPGVTVTTGITSKMDILPMVLFMMMGRGIGTPGRAASGASGMGNDMMMPLMLVLLMQQQQQQQQQATGTTTTGGLDPMMLVLVMMAGGGLS
jgi:hypothetical protein